MSTESKTNNENETAEEVLTDEQLETVAGGAIYMKVPSTSGDANALPMEQISLNYAKLTIEY